MCFRKQLLLLFTMSNVGFHGINCPSSCQGDECPLGCNTTPRTAVDTYITSELTNSKSTLASTDTGTPACTAGTTYAETLPKGALYWYSTTWAQWLYNHGVMPADSAKCQQRNDLTTVLCKQSDGTTCVDNWGFNNAEVYFNDEAECTLSINAVDSSGNAQVWKHGARNVRCTRARHGVVILRTCAQLPAQPCERVLHAIPNAGNLRRIRVRPHGFFS